MDDLKSKSALLKATNTGMTIIEFAQALIDAPVVDAESVRHGRWIISGKSNRAQDMTCSVCEFKISTYNYSRADLEIKAKNTLYCEKCGAKMDLEEKHESE